MQSLDLTMVELRLPVYILVDLVDWPLQGLLSPEYQDGDL